MRKYIGYTISNRSDAAFPIYVVTDPNGNDIDTTLFPSEFKKIVDKDIKEKKTLEAL